jgi:hypothetical protein
VVVPRFERIAACTVVLVIASLALPIAAGADWMGEQRFATPFLAMAHVAYALLIGVSLATLTRVSPRRWRASRVLAVGVILLVGLSLDYDPLEVDGVDLNPVSIANVARLEGAQRWEQQMRLGLPYPVVQIPDAGGTLLVGAMQMLDNGYLTDFQLARIGRSFEQPLDLRVVDQYEHEERRPDLMAIHPAFFLDRSYLHTRYLPPNPDGVLWARRDLAAAQLDAADVLVHDEPGFQLYLSQDTVWTAGPHGLVRCELIMKWTGAMPDTTMVLRGSIAGGDRDQVSLYPYQREANGTERIALLLGAPDRAGRFGVSLELVHGDRVSALGEVHVVEVIDEPAARIAAAGAALHAPPHRAVRRLAWLREQLVPRLGMTAFRALLDHLARADRRHEPSAGRDILKLRDNARLATLDDLDLIADLEPVAARAMLATCSAPARIACLGRVVDELRRLGYLRIVERVPELADELAAARARVDGATGAEKYELLVGLLLADPSDIALQRQLLVERHAVAEAGAFPALP